MISDFFASWQWYESWNWLLVAAVLFILEVIVPGFFFIWLALAATVVGLTLFLVPLTLPWQIVEFSAGAIVSMVIGKSFWGSQRNDMTDKPLLNQRGQQLIGQTFELAEEIRLGRGRVRVADGLWNARGPDMPVGTKVRVVGADGTDLIVEAVNGA
jgi:inner membrane protein